MGKINMAKNNVSLNFTISKKKSSWDGRTESNIIAEASLENNCLLLEKKSLLKRKKIATEKINYSDIKNISLNESKISSLSLAIDINYLNDFISLRTSDSFAGKWFYEKLIDYVKLANENSGNNSTANFIKRMKEPVSTKEFKSIKRQEKFHNCSHSEF